jgi:replicative DNA helicase
MSARYASSLEKSVIGLCLLDARLIGRAERDLEAEDFDDPRHRKIFTIILELGRAQRTVDIAAVALEARRSGSFDDDDEAYLGSLISDPGATDPRAFDERVRLLREESLRRQAEAALKERASESRDRTVPLSETLAAARRAIGELEATEGNEELPPIAVAADTVLDQLDRGVSPGTPTGLPNLDDAIQGGIKPSQLVVIAGNTGSGKTSLAMQIGLLAAQWAGRRREERGYVLIFSLEMSAIELVIRMVSQVVAITDGYRPPSGFSDRDKPKVREALARIKELPIRVEVPRRSTVDGIRASVERFIGEHGVPSLVVVDHIGLLKDPKVKGGRTEEVGSITRGLKEMAMQLDLPVLALAQLNREVGKRDDHRPQLSDLRESGSIEQDANVVALVHRPSYYLKDLEERRRLEESGAEAYVMIAKNRSGPTAEVLFEWVGPRYLFRVPMDWAARTGMGDDYGIIESPHAGTPTPEQLAQGAQTSPAPTGVPPVGASEGIPPEEDLFA